jgi:hypothetical protein
VRDDAACAKFAGDATGLGNGLQGSLDFRHYFTSSRK